MHVYVHRNGATNRSGSSSRVEIRETWAGFRDSSLNCCTLWHQLSAPETAKLSSARQLEEMTEEHQVWQINKETDVDDEEV